MPFTNSGTVGEAKSGIPFSANGGGSLTADSLCKWSMAKGGDWLTRVNDGNDSCDGVVGYDYSDAVPYSKKRGLQEASKIKHKNSSYELHLYYIELNKPNMQWIDDCYNKKNRAPL